MADSRLKEELLKNTFVLIVDLARALKFLNKFADESNTLNFLHFSV